AVQYISRGKPYRVVLSPAGHRRRVSDPGSSARGHADGRENHRDLDAKWKARRGVGWYNGTVTPRPSHCPVMLRREAVVRHRRSSLVQHCGNWCRRFNHPLFSFLAEKNNSLGRWLKRCLKLLPLDKSLLCTS